MGRPRKIWGVPVRAFEVPIFLTQIRKTYLASDFININGVNSNYTHSGGLYEIGRESLEERYPYPEKIALSHYTQLHTDSLLSTVSASSFLIALTTYVVNDAGMTARNECARL